MYLLVAILLAAQLTYMDYYEKGVALYEQGNLEDAESELKRSLASRPNYIPAIRALAELHAKKGELNEAISLYQRIVRLTPKNISARARLAELYSWNGDYEKAIVLYEDTLKLDPENQGVKTSLATVLRWAQRFGKAERLYKEVLEEEPDNYEALKGLAKTYALMGDYPDAIAHLNKAIELYPDAPELYKERGTVLAWQKKFKQAVENLKKAVELKPDYAQAYKTLGDVYYWMKDYKASIEAYKKALSIESDSVESHLSLAKVYMAMGNTYPAEEAVKSALRIDPSNPRALNLLNEIRGEDKARLTELLWEGIELVVFLMVLTLVFFTYRSKRRMLKRRHRLYLYFTNLVLPLLAIVSIISIAQRDVLAQYIDPHLVEDITEAVLFFVVGISFITLLWVEHRTKEFREMVILAIGAHPDDVELGCGGFIMKAKDSGARVYGLILTRGERGTERDRRKEEFEKAAKFMELDGYWIEEFRDTALSEQVSEIKSLIEERILQTGANLVLTHTPLDIHSDHKAVFEATKEGARKVSIMCYEDVSTPREFVPHYFVDITNYIDDKIKLISFHRTQADKPYMDPEAIKGRAAHRGLQCGVPYAEAFRIYKLVR